MSGIYLKSIERLVRDEWYQSGLMASVDWVAGGNFDGYIYRKLLKFQSNSNIVELKHEIVESRGEYYGNKNTIIGSYSSSYKGSISVSFDDFSMNGFVLGKKNEFIAFDYMRDRLQLPLKEAYKLKE